MTVLTDLGVAALRDGVRSGSFSAREVADAFIVAVIKAKPLNAFLVETPDHAIAAAKEVLEPYFVVGEILEMVVSIGISRGEAVECMAGVSHRSHKPQQETI
jgi:aspartyl-tRNA(Asn)/glutamyl-tRNA(Gln) amidotransferase subunit A